MTYSTRRLEGLASLIEYEEQDHAFPHAVDFLPTVPKGHIRYSGVPFTRTKPYPNANRRTEEIEPRATWPDLPINEKWLAKQEAILKKREEALAATIEAGPRILGRKQIRTKAHRVRDVKCPVCKAKAGKMCTRPREYWWMEHRAHPERYAALRKKFGEHVNDKILVWRNVYK